MEFIGEYLKRNRIEQQIKLKSVSDELKISLSTLEDIEKDYFPVSVYNAFLVGHIRSYSKFLDLNEKKIVNDFKIQNSHQINNSVNKISKPLENFNIFSFPKSFSYLSSLVFATGFYFLFINKQNIEIDYAMTPDVPENYISDIEETNMNIELSKKSIKQEESLFRKQQKKISEFEMLELHNSSSVIASLPNETDIKKIKKIIILKFTNPTWMQIRDEKDSIVLSKLMDNGDEYTYSTSDNYTLTAGNAGNIIIAIDDIVIGRAGKLGEVVDSLIINKYFNQ